MNNKHTPTPWELGRNTFTGNRLIMAAIRQLPGRVVGIAEIKENAGGSELPSEANAAFIVRAVNAHEPLVDALKLALDTLLDEQCGLLPEDPVALTIKEALALAEGGGK